MKRWYVVHTHSRGERLAMDNLHRQGFDAYLPQYFKRRRHARKVEMVSAPLFPRYLFVGLDLRTARWHAIKSTFGVKCLVRHGDKPAPVPMGVVENIQAHEDGDGKVVMGKVMPFKKNEVVQFNVGAFSDQTGLFDCFTDDERVIVLLELLGRQVKVRVPMEAISVYA